MPERRADGVTRADGGEQHQVALLELALRDGVASSKRQRAGRGVAVAVDIHQNAFGFDPEAIARGRNDAQIGLVRDHDRHVV